MIEGRLMLNDNDVKIRPFDLENDLNGALVCFNEGFRHIIWPFIDHASPEFNLDCIRWFYKMSRTSFVAEVNGEIHGVLLGAAPFNVKDIISMLSFSFFTILPKVLINAYRFNTLAYKHFSRILYGYSYFLFFHPTCTKVSEITLFTSRKTYRGQGLGRKLMDAYLKTVKTNGLIEATVCTDTAVSYQFYESYGFDRIREFDMKAYKYSIPGESFTGIIYRIAANTEKWPWHI
jgi:GNAT superfamily N-acetyltransferase